MKQMLTHKNNKKTLGTTKNSSTRKLARPSSSQNQIQQLHSSIGNQAVQKLFEQGSIQEKLKIGNANDKYEQEADRVAEQIMNMPEQAVVQRKAEENELIQSKSIANTITPLIQRQEEPEEEEELQPGYDQEPEEPLPILESVPTGDADELDEEKEEFIQPKRNTGTAPQITPGIAHAIHSIKGSGQPLPKSERAFFEPRFGTDFSNVRIHTSPHASDAAQSIQARAFTYGKNIVFGADQYQPTSNGGRWLMAHELTHVVQQSTAPSAIRRGIMKDSMPVVRRAPAKLQKVGSKHSQNVKLLIQQRGKDQVRVNVVRTLEACPCRQVSFKKEGVFYNDDLKNLAIAYRYCSSGTTVDVYAALQSNADAFLKGTAPPLGTARIGIDINIWARTQGGRIVVEAIGTNEGGSKGVGGRAQLIYQGKKWRVVLEPQFLRRLQSLPGASTKNELQLKLGGKIGNATIQLRALNLLDPGKVGGSGEFCYKLTGNLNLCVGLMVTKVPGRRPPNVIGQIGVKIPFPLPKVEKSICRNCFCPPPVPTYKCYETILPRKQEKPKTPKAKDFRYYFKYNSTGKSEEDYLQAQSARNLSNLVQEVRKGGSIDHITGYASPEATEKYNKKLSAKRAKKMHTILQTQLRAGVVLPDPTAGGELLGSTPTKSPSSRLVDIIAQAGFQSADELTKQLAGKEIPNRKLAKQFISLFQAITKPSERLTLLGLSTNDKIAPEVLKSIQAYIDGEGKGRRPWEQIFRLLRIALTRVIPATPRILKDEGGTGQSKPQEVKRDKCQQYAKDAEKRKLFGDIHPSAKKPKTKKEESDSDCLLKPTAKDLKRDCKYSKPKIPPKPTGTPKGITTRSPEVEEEMRRRKEEELKGPKIAPHPLNMR